ncbi:MAG: hypothetical protein ACFCAD_01540 [Pleurocapsa sp.]
MERGLLWLPLLVAFIWLAWSGWNEYQKLEAYKVWAENFDNAKFDIYAVLGKKGRNITWGKPTRKGMVQLDSFSVDEVEEINLLVNDNAVDLDNLPSKGKPFLEFTFSDRKPSLRIPFTDISLAAKWLNYIYQDSQ